MSFNGLTASFLPFTINGLTDATFSNSNIGNAIATTLQLTSATPLKLARFNADRELVSGSVDESQVALLVGNNVFNGSQTILPGSATNINNVINTAITYEAYNEADFTTSGISGYTPPLGTLSGPTMGEYSIGQTANDRTVMRIDGFVPTAKTWVYSFVIRIVDAAEGYLSVEQSGVQRSSTIRLITSELTTVSDTFTYDPASGPIVFKIYTGSLDPWNASWSSFTLGSYTASITAPLSAPLVATEISTMTIGAEILSFPPISSVNSEAWSVYAVSTMGNPSTLGGLIFQEATLGVGAYITGGVVGATSFQFNTISGNAGKVVVTNGDQVMSTSISAGQLQYLTGLTSQAANSITTGTDKITQQYNATTGDISTLINRATLDASIAGLGAGILSLANTWTNTNTFQSTLTTAEGYTTSINGALSTILNDQGFTSASFTTAGITGAYTPPLGTITNPSGSTYQITQTAQARSIMAISGFTPSVGITYLFEFNIKCTIGTATISVEQNNIMRSPALYQLTTGFNVVKGSFTYDGTPNTVVFKIYTGVASWNAQWDSFTLSTYSVGLNANMNALTVNNRFTQRYNASPGDVSTLVNRATMDSAISSSATPNLLPLANVWTATNTFNNSLQVAGGNMTCSLGTIAKQTATVGSLVQIAGGGATNSPYLEFFFGTGGSRGYIGNATATDLDLVAQNGVKLNFYTQGTKRMEIETGGDVVAQNNLKCAGLIVNGGGTWTPGAIYSDVNWGMLFRAKVVPNNSIFGWCDSAGTEKMKMLANGSMTHTSGDSSYMRYGPNGSWNSYLTVGATPDKSGASNAQVITTNGNLHLDAGNSNDIYYGYYPYSRGTPNPHRFYGGNYNFNGLPQNSSQYSQVVCIDGDTLRRSQCMMRQNFKNENIGWTGGGFNYSYAFYKHNASCPVRISGRYSYFVSNPGSTYINLRIYSHATGAYYYYTFHHYQNFTYGHTTYPLDFVLYGSDLPTGWFDTYIYNAGGAILSDGNDQLQLNVMVLPVDNF